MSKRNRKLTYDKLKATGRDKDISPKLKAEFAPIVEKVEAKPNGSRTNKSPSSKRVR